MPLPERFQCSFETKSLEEQKAMDAYEMGAAMHECNAGLSRLVQHAFLVEQEILNAVRTGDKIAAAEARARLRDISRHASTLRECKRSFKTLIEAEK